MVKHTVTRRKKDTARLQREKKQNEGEKVEGCQEKEKGRRLKSIKGGSGNVLSGV